MRTLAEIGDSLVAELEGRNLRRVKPTLTGTLKRLVNEWKLTRKPYSEITISAGMTGEYCDKNIETGMRVFVMQNRSIGDHLIRRGEYERGGPYARAGVHFVVIEE